MPIRRSPNGARHVRPQLVAIARNGWSRSIGTPGRNQLERVVAITRCAHTAATAANESKAPAMSIMARISC
jgi:hypothetical protein